MFQTRCRKSQHLHSINDTTQNDSEKSMDNASNGTSKRALLTLNQCSFDIVTAVL